MSNINAITDITDLYIKGKYDLKTISNRKFIKNNLSNFSYDEIYDAFPQK